MNWARAAATKDSILPMTSAFHGLGLAEPIVRALGADNYLTPTPIQAQAIPAILAGGDVLGIAQTGTGKTAAFALPILHRLAANRIAPGPRAARALVLAPTRELALQIAESFRGYGRHLGLRLAAVYGGVGHRPQIDALMRGVDVLVATPGRLLDLMGQRCLSLDRVSVLVLDEADRMLDMGFIRDVRRITAALPRARQSLLFSATMPTSVAGLAAELLNRPVRVEVAPAATPIERIEQRVLLVEAPMKRAKLAELLGDPAMARVIVFTRTKRGADRLTRHLDAAGIDAQAIHGDKSQGARQRALKSFHAGSLRVLVATDIAARGIDVDGVTHVVNFELPHEPESYVHRIGRTARAGAGGTAISLCDPSERGSLRAIERLTGRTLPVTGAAAAGAPACLGRAANDDPGPRRGTPRPPISHWRRRGYNGRRAA
jgi:ATP-dependent RNA helicase RhlE